MASVPYQNQPISSPITVTADTTPVRVPLPDARNGLRKIVLSVYESAGPVELVSNTSESQGLTLPTTAAADINLLAGTYRLRNLELYVRASAPTSITFVFVLL